MGALVRNVLNLQTINALNANPTKWSSTLKQFVGKLPTNYLSMFDHLVGLVFKGFYFSQATESVVSCFECQKQLSRGVLRNTSASLKSHFDMSAVL